MSLPYTELSKKNCAFVIHIGNPLETLEKLSQFFSERKIVIDTMNMNRYTNGEAMLIIHCQLEKDRVSRTAQKLEGLTGIISVERLEGK